METAGLLLPHVGTDPLLSENLEGVALRTHPDSSVSLRLGVAEGLTGLRWLYTLPWE